ncbi:hypothetical protein MRX96_007265 [Rhipicephalus microplus]
MTKFEARVEARITTGFEEMKLFMVQLLNEELSSLGRGGLHIRPRGSHPDQARPLPPLRHSPRAVPTLRKRIAQLGREIKKYSQQHCAQQWHAICNEADSRLHTSRTWKLLRHLRDETQSKSYQQHRLAQILRAAMREHEKDEGRRSTASPAARLDLIHNKALRNLNDAAITALTGYYNKNANKRKAATPTASLHADADITTKVTTAVTAAISTLKSDLNAEIETRFNAIHQTIRETTTSFAVLKSSTEAALADFSVQLAIHRTPSNSRQTPAPTPIT